MSFVAFVAPSSGKSLMLRLKHSGKENRPLEVTLGLTIIQLHQLHPSSKLPLALTIDDFFFYPSLIPGPSESDHLSFEPGNDMIVIRFRGTVYLKGYGHILHDIELLES